MRIGVPREIKDQEYRVALTPAGAHELVSAGHEVLIESGAGAGSRLDDDAYRTVGARIVNRTEDAWAVEMVLKVKEPLEDEYHFLRPGLVLFTFLHLAGVPALTERLRENGVTALGYETVELPGGDLPLLAPMSEIAGRLAAQVAAHYLEHPAGGMGRLFGGIPGVPPAKISILGIGSAGRHAAMVAAMLGGNVTGFDRRVDRLRYLTEHHMVGNIATAVAAPSVVAEAVMNSHVVIGAVLRSGERAPRVVTREMVRNMPDRAVIVDISVDQGGCVETTHATSHTDPVYVEEGVLHYAVPNMPGAVPHTSTHALCSATQPYILNVASLGVEEAARRDAALARGINVFQGTLVNRGVGESLGLDVTPLNQLISGVSP